MTSRRFPPPWQVEQIDGGFKVLDASGQALVYVYARETRAEADIAKVLTLDEARRIAVNVAKLPGLLASKAEPKANAPDLHAPVQKIIQTPIAKQAAIATYCQRGWLLSG
jgi:hypothetical protein